MLLMSNGSIAEVLVSITVSGKLDIPTFVLGKVSEVGVNDVVGAGTTTVPLRLRICVVGLPVSVSVTEALTAPPKLPTNPTGVKVPVIMQVPLAASVSGARGQVSVKMN